ncbi:MAG: hypothetical protein WD069_14715 [Planctomycetales bacterium]
MLTRIPMIAWLLPMAAGAAFLAGCGDDSATTGDGKNATTNSTTTGTPDEHADPHDVPMTEAEIEQLRQETATWDAAIQHVQTFRDTIRTETTGGVPAKAHRSLDKLDYVLRWLPEIAQQSQVPRDQWQTVGENAQQLRDLFDRVHTNIDAGKKPDYEAVAEEIDRNIAALAKIEAKPAAPSN